MLGLGSFGNLGYFDFLAPRGPGWRPTSILNEGVRVIVFHSDGVLTGR
jgi:hypothetical protein